MVDIRAAAAHGFLLNNVGRLSFSACKQHDAPIGRQLVQKLHRLVE